MAADARGSGAGVESAPVRARRRGCARVGHRRAARDSRVARTARGRSRAGARGPRLPRVDRIARLRVIAEPDIASGATIGAALRIAACVRARPPPRVPAWRRSRSTALDRLLARLDALAPDVTGPVVHAVDAEPAADVATLTIVSRRALDRLDGVDALAADVVREFADRARRAFGVTPIDDVAVRAIGRARPGDGRHVGRSRLVDARQRRARRAGRGRRRSRRRRGELLTAHLRERLARELPSDAQRRRDLRRRADYAVRDGGGVRARPAGARRLRARGRTAASRAPACTVQPADDAGGRRRALGCRDLRVARRRHCALRARARRSHHPRRRASVGAPVDAAVRDRACLRWTGHSGVRWMPRRLFRWFERRAGWHTLIKATLPALRRDWPRGTPSSTATLFAPR